MYYHPGAGQTWEASCPFNDARRVEGATGKLLERLTVVSLPWGALKPLYVLHLVRPGATRCHHFHDDTLGLAE
jgi:hypothetical protein